jgi:hypothetical protein
MNRPFTIIVCCGCLIARLASADIMMAGPVTVAAKTGSVFSNPSLMHRDLGVSLADADVQINLSAPDADALVAVVEAKFLMKRYAGDLGPVQFLAAFPICHYRHPFLTLDDFAVFVDGKSPPMVIRKTESVGYPVWTRNVVCDSPVNGELPDTMRLPSLAKREQEWQAKWGTGSRAYGASRWNLTNLTETVTLPDGSHWEYCYVWLMKLEQGGQSKVTVRYSCKIPRQENVWRVENQLGHRGERSPRAKMAHNIPESFYHKVGAGDFFFFSYLLRSGATWHGPIGSERIRIVSTDAIPLDRAILDVPVEVQTHPHEIVVQISKQDPDFDLILAIPGQGDGKSRSAGAATPQQQ